MNHISLFSGIGGFDLAAERQGFENVAHCEIEDFPRKILAHYWPGAESFTDITTTDFTKYENKITVLSGGFPCQDASIANPTGKGIRGDRTGLVFHMLRAIREIRPRYVIAENVSNLLRINNGKDFGEILYQLSSMGFNAEWRVVRGYEQGAPHKRERVYLVAYSNSIRLQERQTFIPFFKNKVRAKGWEFAGTIFQIFRGGYWSAKPPVLLLDDGFPYPVDSITLSQWRRQSIKGFGNSIIPQIAESIFKQIKNNENKTGTPRERTPHP